MTLESLISCKEVCIEKKKTTQQMTALAYQTFYTILPLEDKVSYSYC